MTKKNVSNQSQMIHSAMKKADKAMAKSNYGANYPGSMESSDATSQSSSLEGDTTIGNTTIQTETDGTLLPSKSPRNVIPTSYPPPGTIAAGTVRTNSTLNLRTNDNQFHVIANLILSKYEVALRTGAKHISATAQHKEQLDRMVSRDSFVDAVRFRLAHCCPEDSMMPIHVATRQCRALGLHRSGNLNLLYAPVGQLIPIESAARITKAAPTSPIVDMHAELQRVQENIQTTQPLEHGNPESLGRQQLLAELRESSNLMAESVTPEAAQFWRKHVVELQTRLRALHEKGDGSSSQRSSIAVEAEEVMRNNERLMADLNENLSYVAPSREELSQHPRNQLSPSSTVSRTQSQPRSMQHQEPLLQQDSNDRPATRALDPEFQGLPMVDVVAPSNLPEGYTFEAEIDGKRFLASVPVGGVRKGQTFTCYMRDCDKVDSDIPVGHWRDGLFDYNKHGIFHPMTLNSCFCPLVALAQIMTRMGLDFTGQRRPDTPQRGLFSTWGMIMSIFVFWVLLNTVVVVGLQYKDAEGISISGADIASLMLVNVGMAVYVVYAASNTRSFIREKYMVQEKFCCRDLEDIVYSSVCLPCTISQMGRHTAAYDVDVGHCCSDTGLPAGVESDITTRKHIGSYRLW